MIRMRDKIAEEWLKRKVSGLLSHLAAARAKTAQDVIASGMEQGLNPKNVGLELAGRIDKATGERTGGHLVLSEHEREKVVRFNKCLVELDDDYFGFDLRDKRFDRSFSRAVREQINFEDKKVSHLTMRFHDKLLKHSADVIAQTEMLAALNRSEYVSTKSALEDSPLPDLALKRFWDSCGDDKVRPSHRALDGQCVIGLSKSFVSPLNGSKMMYPGDTSLGASENEVRGCRCRVRYDIDFAYGVK